MEEYLAAANPFGTIRIPVGLSRYSANPGVAIGQLIQFALRGLIIIAGIYALFNLVLAGYAFMSAGDDAKKVTGAWAQIYQTIIGLAVTAGSFVLAAIIGKLIFNDWSFLLKPAIPIP